jgi:putative oxidoreductase
MKNLKEKLLRIAACKIYIAETWLAPVALLAARLYLARAFWKSGLTKFANLDSATALFRDEYIPQWEKNHVKHILGLDIPFPVPDAAFAAYASTAGELVFAALLALGLMGRAAAFGLFMMALCIELFVYPGSPEHPGWLLLSLIIVAVGPGKISLDWLIRRKLLPESLCDRKTA